ncbi:MAG TPA: tagaturonate reductase [Ginsengibacter sp.]|nr:tagaturonate reductase [Ginsengibacter sp.]
MKLSAYTLKNITSEKVDVPEESILELPEKVLQFGTGVLLRGLPDYFIDKANKMGIFNGRVVIVKTTSRGDTADFGKQDGLYTLCVRGIQDGQKIEENIINSSISRVLSASHEWEQILECAHNQSLQIIISNTTEVGIKLMNEDVRRHPPISYPGKLLAFLYERFTAFGGSEKSGLVIVPTELIPDNGKKLESIVLELAHLNGLQDDFIEWLEHCNYFCNSLVDRIVTGMPDEEIKIEIEKELGYTDQLLTVCEVYRLWAIEGNEHVKKILSFAGADEGVIIEPDIDLYRELKLRLLNGTHTLSCGIAFLAGVDTVKQGMDDPMIEKYVADVMRNEIGPSIPYEINAQTVQAFIAKVLDRFRNPHINHFWKSITLNYTQKLKMRCIPLLLNYYKNNNSVPELFALGYAAYIYFMKPVRRNGDEFFGEFKGKPYLIEDEVAEKFYKLWQKFSLHEIVNEVLKDVALWGKDLSNLPGFQQSVEEKLDSIINNGMRATLENAQSKKMLI